MSVELFPVSAAKISSLRCGGEIRRACYPKTEEEVTEIYERFGDEVLFLGGLTNTLVCEEGMDEIALFTDRLKGISTEGEVLCASAGERIAKVASYAAKRGLTGLESLSGIPGTVGGAVKGNAGAYGTELSDLLVGVDVFRFDTGRTEYLTREEIAFSYRYSNLSAREFVLRCYLSLRRDNVRDIVDRTEEYRRKRLLSQPKEPSLGSVFKRYSGSSMGWYIERCGLKGASIGAFCFSNRHAGFIVNRFSDPASNPADYLSLVALAEKRVYEEFGIKPVREVKIIGDKRQTGE